MSSRRINYYELICDKCGSTERVECMYKLCRFLYIDDPPEGWTEEISRKIGFRGMEMVEISHFCPKCIKPNGV